MKIVLHPVVDGDPFGLRHKDEAGGLGMRRRSRTGRPLAVTTSEIALKPTTEAELKLTTEVAFERVRAAKDADRVVRSALRAEWVAAERAYLAARYS